MLPNRKKRVPARESIEVTQGILAVNHNIGLLLHFSYCEGIIKDDKFVPDMRTVKHFEFKDDDYIELLKANPEWSPDKPSNTFRSLDLIEAMDYILNKRVEVVEDTEAIITEARRGRDNGN